MGSESLETPGLPQWPIWSSLVLTVKMCQMSVRVLRRQKTRSSSQFRESRVLFFWCFPVKKSWPSWVCLFLWLYVSHCFVRFNLHFPSRRSDRGKSPPLRTIGGVTSWQEWPSRLPWGQSQPGWRTVSYSPGLFGGRDATGSPESPLLRPLSGSLESALHSVHRVLFHTRTELSGSTGKEVSSEVHYLKLGIRSHESWKIIQIRL